MVHRGRSISAPTTSTPRKLGAFYFGCARDANFIYSTRQSNLPMQDEEKSFSRRQPEFELEASRSRDQPLRRGVRRCAHRRAQARVASSVNAVKHQQPLFHSTCASACAHQGSQRTTSGFTHAKGCGNRVCIDVSHWILTVS